MKLKTMIKGLSVSFLTLFVIMLSNFEGKSQACTSPANSIMVTIDSVVTDANSITFSIMIKNTNATTFNITAFSPAIDLTSNTLFGAAGTGTYTVIRQPNTVGFTGFNNVTPTYVVSGAIRQVKLAQVVASGVNRNLATNVNYEFARVKFTNLGTSGINWASNQAANMSFHTAAGAGGVANTIMNNNCGSAGSNTVSTGLSLASKTITLNPASGPTASVIANGTGSSSICNPGTANVKVTITGGTGPYSVWANGNSTALATGYTSGADIAVSPMATTTYTLDSVKDAGSNAGTGNSGSAVVTVNSGTNNAPTTASDCSSYTWSVNGTTYSASGTYQHIGTNVNGCPDTNTLNLTIGDPTIALASVGNTGSVVGSNVCGTQLQANGTSSYADGSCHPILSINTASALGSVTACANVMGSTPAMSNGQTFGKRWYSISPASAGTGSVTFYYTQADFTSYNAGNGTMDMPTVGGGTANINNMRIAQIENGILSTATSYPAVLVWDATNGYWKATITGASIVSGGQYYFYGEPECNLSVNAATIAASAITATSANVTWDAVAGAVGYVVRWRTGTNSWLSASTATNSRTLTGLSASTAYEVQVRTICNGGWGLNSTSGNFSTIAAPVLPACVTPTGLAASNITLTTADLTWNASNNATHYYIRWRPTSGGAYTAAYVTTASGLLTRTLPGLTPGTQYEAQIMLFCTGAMTATSAWSSAITFTTTAGVIPPACVAPTGLTAMSITPTSATATWNAAANATAYQVIWSVQGSGTWLSAYTSTLSRVLSPLANNTNYDMQVKAYCTGTAGSSSSFSPVVTFSTGAPAKQAILATTGVSVYPNPTSGDLTIDLSVENELMTTIKVMDMSGRVVKQIQATTHAGQNSIKMNIDELTTGLYTIQVINNDRVINTSRVSKN